MPCWLHSGIIYAADDGGLERAFNYRLACKREPLVPGYHEALIENQTNFFNKDWHLRVFEVEFSEFVHVWFTQHDDLDEALRKYASQPHKKRRLRMRALLAILDAGDWYHKTWTRKVLGKVKRAEIAKEGKATRLINDLSPEGSLICGFVADELKKAMAKFTEKRAYQFIKSPNLVDLSQVFGKLINPEGRLYFPFFSDDSCVSIRCTDGIYMANVDISSCDGSHTKAVFDLLRRVTRKDSRLRRYIDGAIRQCEMPLTMVSGSGREKVVLKPTSPVLYSGSTLTTLINNFANVAIACALLTRLDNVQPRKADCQELIKTAAQAAGYIVTVEQCDTYHSLQFLKHSPCLSTTGVIVPVLNLGVLMRSFGTCWGDLPTYRKLGKYTFAQRRFLWNTSQVQCYKNCVTHPFLSALRSRFRHGVDLSGEHDSWVVNNLEHNYSHLRVSADEVVKRYGITVTDLEELEASVWEDAMINIAASRAILQTDYGLSTPGG